MYFICIACLNGSERLHQNNNVQWTAENGVRSFIFFINAHLSLILILIDSYCGAEGSILIPDARLLACTKETIFFSLSPYPLHGTSTVSLLFSVFLIGSFFLFQFGERLCICPVKY
jgi:hypothetical protein